MAVVLLLASQYWTRFLFLDDTGVLALPFALRQAGLVVGLVLLLGAGAATVASIGILVQAHAYYGYDTYEALAQAVVSIRCRHAIESSLLVFCCGCAVAYVIAVGDIANQAGLDSIFSDGWGRTMTILIAYTVAMLPLSLLRRVQSLQYASCFSIIAIFTLVIASLLHLMQNGTYHGSDMHSVRAVYLPSISGWTRLPNEEGDVRLSDFWWPENGLVSVLTACPIVLFAFSCQANVCSIYHELTVPSTISTGRPSFYDAAGVLKQKLMRRVTVLAVCICAALYASISLVALADFGRQVQSNMLSCYVNAGPVMQFATAAMAVAIILAFPLNIFPARVTLLGLLAKHGRRVSRQIDPPWGSERMPNESLTAALLQDAVERPNRDGGSRDPQRHGDETDHVMHLSIHGTSNTHFESSDDNNSIRPQSHDDAVNFDLQLHIISTVFLTGSVLVMALVLPNISVVFGLLGGTASSILGFCVPGLLGIRLSKDLENETGERHRRMMITSWLLLSGGVAVGILTTGVTMYTTLLM
jgi:amino acid permease